MGFLSGVLGTKNEYGDADHPLQQANLATTDYSGAQAQGLAGQGDARGQQSALAQMLFQQANGGGPNPAQLQLQQATDANGRAAASAVASQRGLNPALAARQILDSQNQLNQQAAGQSGVMRAQQQLGAQSLLGNVLQGQRGQDLGLYGQAGGLQNGQNQVLNQQAQGNNQILAGVSAGNAQTNGQIAGGILGGIGSVGAAAAGKPPGAAYGGEIQNNGAPPASPLQSGFAKAIGAALRYGNNKLGDSVSTMANGGAVAKPWFQRDGVDPWSQAKDMTAGGHVPGRASVPGDSPRNDTQKADLSPGEIVLPRSVAMAEDAPDRAAAFVRAIRRRKEAANGPGYGKVLAAYRGGRAC